VNSLSRPTGTAALLIGLGIVAGCSSAAGRAQTGQVGVSRPVGGRLSPAAVARADSGRPPYTPADVRFMQGMIDHHAQAILMAGWAPSHGASASLQGLAERIVVAQRDEIATMKQWLGDRHETVPAGDAAHDMMPGMDHARLMPGMLTAEELVRLDRARGAEFDRLFLTFMIRHHEGALTMVEQLFASNGAGQDEDIFKFASDVHADQTSEITRMTAMLDAMSQGK
jgi:uncharacterized protein (DUF305 family)